MKKIIALVLFGMSVMGGVPKALLQKPVVTASQILNWADPKNPAALASVEELLSKLPDDYKRYFTLVYDSNSNHTATPEYPRVIFFGPDAKLLLAFSGYPSDPEYNSVEMIEYEQEKGAFFFYRLQFTGDKKNQIEVNPNDCLSCHGSPARPNWEPYSLWPGAYGSLHDRIPYGSKENVNFRKFLQSYLNSSRYQMLPKPFYTEGGGVGGKTDFYLSTNGVGPGSSLSILASFLNRDRIAKIMVNSKDHAIYRPAITAALIGCKQPIDFFLPSKMVKNHPLTFQQVYEETERKMSRDFQIKLNRLKRDLGVDEEFVTAHADMFGMRSAEIDRIAKLRFLLLNRLNDSVDTDSWSLSFSKTALDFNDGVSGLENLAGHYLPLAYAEQDPIRKLISLNVTPFPFTKLESGEAYAMEAFYLRKDYAEACELILKEAKLY